MLDLKNKIEKTIFREKYLKNIDEVLKLRLINVIVWPRRVGKSYFLYSVLKYLLEKNKVEFNQIFYVNKEWSEFDEINDYESLKDFFLKQKINKNKTFFVWLDEVQEIEWWEKFVLDIYSKYENAIIYITWSNSKLLSSKYSTLLSGRYLEKIIYPLDFKEFCQFSWKEPSKKIFYEYLEFGWLPKIPFIKDFELRYDYLNWVYNTVFTKDVVEFFRIRNVSILRKINKYLFKELGALFTANNIAKYFKSQKINVSVDTVLNYLEYSKSAFLFSEIERYDLKWKKILEVNSKIYSFDLWIRNSVVWFNLVWDIEKFLELVVLNFLLSNWYKVNIWVLDNKEIDFVANKNWKIIYIQVCYLLSDKKVIDREFWNLLEIKDNYEKIVLSLDELPLSDYKWIRHYNLIDFILNN